MKSELHLGQSVRMFYTHRGQLRSPNCLLSDSNSRERERELTVEVCDCHRILIMFRKRRFLCCLWLQLIKVRHYPGLFNAELPLSPFYLNRSHLKAFSKVFNMADPLTTTPLAHWVTSQDSITNGWFITPRCLGQSSPFKVLYGWCCLAVQSVWEKDIDVICFCPELQMNGGSTGWKSALCGPGPGRHWTIIKQTISH